MLDFDGTRKSRRRDAAIAAVFVLLSVILLLVPTSYKEPVRTAMRGTVLSPFLGAQARITANRVRNIDITRIRAQRDSLAALAVAQTALSEENRRLRAMLGLAERAGARFETAQVLRLGLAGTESTFVVDVGEEHGIEPGSPVVAPEGLLGVVLEVDRRTAQAIDWSHPAFRVSAMSADGEAYGMVEPRRGRFREEDMLVLTGAPFHSDIRPGTQVVTSGRGQRYPRGIPVGVVLAIEEADTGWRKSYLIQPAVRPERALHVLVGRAVVLGGSVAEVWQVVPAEDTAPASPSRGGAGGPVTRDGVGQP